MGAGFNPELSGTDNILLNGACSASNAARWSKRSMGSSTSQAFVSSPTYRLKYYSSGMFMRLAFAIATEIDPDILLIDESLGAGDAAFIKKAKDGSWVCSIAPTLS